jgi:acetate kinase
MFKVMAVNAGSSSMKFKLYEMPEEKVLTNGIVERIGHDDAIFSIKNKEGKKITKVLPVADHGVAVKLIMNGLIEHQIIASFDELQGIGHRIVQGGPYFADSHVFDKDTEDKIESLIPLAPLHNKPHLIGFRAFKAALPKVGQIAVFDTAFHQSMDEADYLFPIKHEYYDKYKCRRYGAHGTSHKYLAEIATKKYLHNKKDARILTLHIGSGASLCAVKDNKCVLTSMGLTPLGGIMMGTRTGDLDPSVLNYLVNCTNRSCEDLYQEFNKQSGLLGVSEVSNDTRDIQAAAEKGDPKAKLAITMWARKLAQFIAAYACRLGRVDLIVWSAGIGENAPYYRKAVIDECSEFMGLKLDDKLNEEIALGKEGIISAPDSSIPMVVIPTDEELMIARDIVRILGLK